MMRATVRFLIAAMVCGTPAVVQAQQANTPQATLAIGAVGGPSFGGPPYPITVGGLQGNNLLLMLSGGPSASNLPFAVAYGPVAPGSATTPYGTVDLDLSSPYTALALDGFTPGSPGHALAFLDGFAQFQYTYFHSVGALIPMGLQAAVSAPGSFGGVRMTAALDFAPTNHEAIAFYVGGTAAPAWSNNGGVVTAAPTCPGGVVLNNDLTFVFGGTVDPMTLPTPGSAVGSINIYRQAATSAVYATGRFVIEDDPRFPVGNGRVVRFLPDLPVGGPSCNGAGLEPSSTYTVFVPAQGMGYPAVVSVGGAPLTTSVLTCFSSTSCNTANPAASYVDPTPGPPVVTATTPTLGNPAPPPIPASSISGNTFSITLSEPLLASTVTTSTVQVFNQTLGLQVSGQVLYASGGASPGAGGTPRIDFVAPTPFPHACVYRLEVAATVTDWWGDALQLVPGAPGLPLFLETSASPLVPQPPIVENFSSSAGALTVDPLLTWGGGSLGIQGVPGTPGGGTGAYGALLVNTGPSTLDTGAPASTGFANGVWQTTVFTVQPGANVRLVGPYRAQFNCTGTVTIDGAIDGSAGSNPTLPTGSPNQGAGSGAFNNGGNFAASIVRGGVAGVGGGNGGRASQAGYTARTNLGEPGFGPTINGINNAGPFGANVLFAGGSGGASGFRFPSGGIPGDLGGIGGAGGSAWGPGEDGRPRTSPGAGCNLATAPINQPISYANPVPPVMIFPISVPSAGSGGGGGGDRHEITGPPNDDQGGGGGGGGGGISVFADGNIYVNSGAVLQFDGANGGSGNLFFGGGGGGGSGGAIWLRSAFSIYISTAAQLSVNPGGPANTCNNQASGAGGFGYYQFEDLDGMVNTNFIPAGGGTGGQNISLLTTQGAPGNVTGTATSVFYDTASSNPTYTGVLENLSPGTTGSVTVTYQGAHPSFSNPAQPDLTTITAPVSSAQLSTLNGHRFIRFTATLSYPPYAPGFPPTLPLVNSITINFSS